MNNEKVVKSVEQEFAEAVAWATAAGYSVRNIKTCAWASEETNAYTADIYRDGQRVMVASNRGCGGATNLHAAGTIVALSMEQRAMLEIFADLAVEQHLKDKDAARINKWITKQTAAAFAVGKNCAIIRTGSKVRACPTSAATAEEFRAANPRTAGEVELHLRPTANTAADEALRAAAVAAKHAKLMAWLGVNFERCKASGRGMVVLRTSTGWAVKPAACTTLAEAQVLAKRGREVRQLWLVGGDIINTPKGLEA